MSVLEVRRLSKSFGRVRAVVDLDLAVPAGSVFGILGPNGSGKTTTLAIVLGAMRPDAGSVAWFGGVAAHRARARVGALLEAPAYYPSLTGEQNLAVVARIKKANAEQIDAAIERAGLGARRHSPVYSYSLGMRQRLALAAALLTDPEVLVLDEPANGLDPAGIADLRDLIRSAATRGTTVIVASHVLDELEKTCTHLAILSGGRVAVSGDIHGVLARTGHARLEEAFLSLVSDHAAPDCD
jgi:ABC-2 type transport system ATP-binding protein